MQTYYLVPCPQCGGRRYASFITPTGGPQALFAAQLNVCHRIRIAETACPDCAETVLRFLQPLPQACCRLIVESGPAVAPDQFGATLGELAICVVQCSPVTMTSA